ncbi:DEAD-box ATP-dependent RNA helicase 39 [Tanacetum coccineum]
MVGTSRILTLSLSSTTTKTLFSLPKPYFPIKPLKPFKPLASFSTTTTDPPPSLEQSKHSILLDRLRIRHLKDSVPISYNKKPISKNQKVLENNEVEKSRVFGGFKELGLSDEVLEALKEMGISVPTEIQGVGIPEVIEGKSVVLGSHTGSGKTLAYLLPLVQINYWFCMIGAMYAASSGGTRTLSYQEMGLSDEVLEALKEMGISVPTEIQGVGIPEVIEGKSVVLGSHTGSGKTLAYLLPLVQIKCLVCMIALIYEVASGGTRTIMTGHLKDSVPISYNKKPISKNQKNLETNEVEKSRVFGGFKEMGLSDEVLEALKEMGISVPTEIQGVGIPEVIEGKSVVLGSHKGSGKTLVYMLPLVQFCMRLEELKQYQKPKMCS